MNNVYKIVMKTPLGKKAGRLAFCVNENLLTGSMEILNHQNDIQGEILPNGKCYFTGELITPVRNYLFTAEGIADEEKINLIVDTKTLKMSITGELETKME